MLGEQPQSAILWMSCEDWDRPCIICMQLQMSWTKYHGLFMALPNTGLTDITESMWNQMLLAMLAVWFTAVHRVACSCFVQCTHTVGNYGSCVVFDAAVY